MNLFLEGMKLGSGLVIGVSLALLALSLIQSLFRDRDKDDTDPTNGRSGLKVYVDHKTGIEYIGTKEGGLVKREKVGERTNEII